MALRILKKLDNSALDTACVIIPCFTSDDAKKALVKLGLEKGNAQFVEEFDPSCEDAGMIYSDGKCLAFVGLSKASHYGKMRQVFQVLAGRLKGKKRQTHVLLLSHLQGDPSQTGMLADAAVNGLLLGQYDLGLLKTQNHKSAQQDYSLDVVADAIDIAGAVHVAEMAAGAQQSIYDLVNLPSSHKTPEKLAQWAKASAKDFDYSVEVMDEKVLRERGFDALLAVNRGSEHPARCIVSRYEGTKDVSAPLIALVGKGVTFDTGGVSIKTGDSMHLMKSDMGGAAAVLGAVDLCARLKAPVRVIACAPCTDNSIGTNAIKPGDVIGSYSGKTIEVINTDAEGRLILADALSYVIQEHKPQVIVDVATLTGSVMRALGNHCAGMLTHSDHLAQALADAGDACGERVWRLPLWEEYGDEMKSEIADIKNLSDKPAAGAITAAKFLEFFVEDHPAWAHLDIAGVAFKANGVSKGHAATAFGVRLLYEFVTRYVRR